MTKVAFILDHPLMNYRISFFEKLSERGLDVTVIHTGGVHSLDNVSEIIVNNKEFGKLFYRNLPQLTGFDVVVCMQNIRMINLWVLSLNPFKKYKVYHWGIGLSSSNGLSNQNYLILLIRFFLTKFARKLFLYSDYPKKIYPNKLQNKLINVNNTIHNPYPIDTSLYEKNSFLFIGSLNERKGIEDLILAYYKYFEHHHNPLNLVIVGDGVDAYKDKVFQLVKSLGISNHVDFKGHINSFEDKKEIFSNAVASLSLKQAGLSVLEAFSFGVPFIAYKNAISGGEHLHIKSGYNGFLTSSLDETSELMFRLHENKTLSAGLGHSAYQYYLGSCTMGNMVSMFYNEINIAN